MRWALSVSSAPSVEPLTLQSVIDHLREDIDVAQTSVIDSLIAAARVHTEQFTRRAFVTQTLQYRVASFADRILLPRPPLQSVTSIAYTDLQGVMQTLSADAYDVDTDSEPGVITLGYQQVWPSVRDVQLPITITYIAGYGAASDVPQPIKQAMLMLVAHWYEHRQAVAEGDFTAYPMAVDSLLWPYRVLTF